MAPAPMIFCLFIPQGEHVPDWDYTKNPLINAAEQNTDKIIIDGGCGTLRSALPKYQDQKIAGAYINPPYQARPEHANLALHCDGGHDGLKITRELLEDLIPYLANNGVIAVHTKSPAFKDKNGFAVWPLILDDLVEARIVPKDQIKHRRP